MVFQQLIKILLLLLLIIISYISSPFIHQLFINKYKPINVDKEFYIYEDKIHTEIIIKAKEIKTLNKNLYKLLKDSQYGYLSFSFGEKDFFMKVPTWDDIKFDLTLKALFINTPALIRVSHFKYINKQNCIKIKISQKNLIKLINSIDETFARKDGHIIGCNNTTNKVRPKYYVAKESYNLFYTCNSWTGDRLRDANLPQPFITPFAQQVIYPF